MLSLWNILSNVSTDPIGIQCQWRKSHTERLFHKALDVHERIRVCILEQLYIILMKIINFSLKIFH